jgi:hypothetical protein
MVAGVHFLGAEFISLDPNEVLDPSVEANVQAVGSELMDRQPRWRLQFLSIRTADDKINCSLSYSAIAVVSLSGHS